MEKKLETTIVYRDWDNGNYYSMLGLYGDSGKENGNYYSGVA